MGLEKSTMAGLKSGLHCLLCKSFIVTFVLQINNLKQPTHMFYTKYFGFLAAYIVDDDS